MSFLDDLDNSLISSDLSSKNESLTTSQLEESFDKSVNSSTISDSFGGLDESIITSDMKTSAEEKNQSTSKKEKPDESGSSVYFSSMQSPFFANATEPEKNPLWIQEEILTLKERRARYKCQKFITLKEIKDWSILSKEIKIPSDNREVSFEIDEELNKKIGLIQGDSTTLEVDAIVNAANESLLGGGGIDGAIHRAAGPKLLEECRTLNGAHTGETKITRGYKLPAKYVLHTVGPQDENPEKLESCYKSCLDIAAEHKIRSLVFCGVSTGIFGFPLEGATRIAFNTVRTWLEQNNNRDKMEMIIFCNYLPKEKACYDKLAFEYFPTKEYVEAEKERLEAEKKLEEKKLKDKEEAEKKKKEKEEADKKKKEETDKKKAEDDAKKEIEKKKKEEADRKKKEEEEADKKRKKEESDKKKVEEEMEKKKKKEEADKKKIEDDSIARKKKEEEEAAKKILKQKEEEIAKQKLEESKEQQLKERQDQEKLLHDIERRQEIEREQRREQDNSNSEPDSPRSSSNNITWLALSGVVVLTVAALTYKFVLYR